jgi:hypothetical protein
MGSDGEALRAWRDRVAGLQALPCGMAHENIPVDPNGRPEKNPFNESGYARAGLCPADKRATHLGCSHTMARHILRDALDSLRDPGDAALLDELRNLDSNISLLDHRRFDAELRHAKAVEADDADAVRRALHDIDALVAEHRARNAEALTLRDAVLTRLDAALAVPEKAQQ